MLNLESEAVMLVWKDSRDGPMNFSPMVQNRLLFLEKILNKEEFYTYFRVLETQDEYFPYYKTIHAMARCTGLGTCRWGVEKKVYYKNALSIVRWNG